MKNNLLSFALVVLCSLTSWTLTAQAEDAAFVAHVLGNHPNFEGANSRYAPGGLILTTDPDGDGRGKTFSFDFSAGEMFLAYEPGSDTIYIEGVADLLSKSSAGVITDHGERWMIEAELTGLETTQLDGTDWNPSPIPPLFGTNNADLVGTPDSTDGFVEAMESEATPVTNVMAELKSVPLDRLVVNSLDLKLSLVDGDGGDNAFLGSATSIELDENPNAGGSKHPFYFALGLGLHPEDKVRSVVGEGWLELSPDAGNKFVPQDWKFVVGPRANPPAGCCGGFGDIPEPTSAAGVFLLGTLGLLNRRRKTR